MAQGKAGWEPLSRRGFIKTGLLAGGLATAVFESGRLGQASDEQAQALFCPVPQPDDPPGHEGLGVVGEVDHARNGFDPTALLTDWDYGTVSVLPNGQTLREYNIVAVDKEIEIAPGVFFPAWTYNGRIPGPSLRCVEGDRIRITFSNGSSHPHTIHFHGIHAASMDGVPGVGDGMIEPGDRTVYEFDAYPFGCHLYHCHSLPLEFMKHPIEIRSDQLQRLYLINITEFDPINSIHIHANFFDYYDHGTTLQPTLRTVDTVMQCQAQRGILEFSFAGFEPGKYMFHAHQSEFAELGWMGFFQVRG